MLLYTRASNRESSDGLRQRAVDQLLPAAKGRGPAVAVLGDEYVACRIGASVGLMRDTNGLERVALRVKRGCNAAALGEDDIHHALTVLRPAKNTPGVRRGLIIANLTIPIEPQRVRCVATLRTSPSRPQTST